MQFLFKRLFILCLFIGITTATDAQTALDFIKKGIQLHDENKYDEAIVAFEMAVKIEPKNSTAHYEMANTYAAMGKYDKSIDHAEKVIKLKNGNEGEAYTILGTAYDLSKKPKKAIKAYEDGIKAFPNLYNLYYNLGITQYNQGDLDKAEMAAMGSVKNNPQHANSHFLLASIEMDKGKRIKAMLPLYTYLIIQPNAKKVVAARQMLEKLYKSGANVKQDADSKDVTINLSFANKEEEFGDAENAINLMASIMAIPMDDKIKDSLKLVSTPESKFFDNTQMLFEMVTKEDKDKTKKADSFWQTVYVKPYVELIKKEHVEAFCYFIYGNTEGSKKWQTDNADKVTKLNEWLKEKDNPLPLKH
jgi:Tfp pilus assembly protein PilF